MATKTEKPKKKEAAPKKTAAPQSAAQADTPVVAKVHQHRRVVGTVVSDKMQKTIVVTVDRRVRHALYGKYVVRSQRFKAHDEKNEAKIGDEVQIIESRPLSKDKRWVLRKILRRAGQSAVLNVDV